MEMNSLREKGLPALGRAAGSIARLPETWMGRMGRSPRHLILPARRPRSSAGLRGTLPGLRLRRDHVERECAGQRLKRKADFHHAASVEHRSPGSAFRRPRENAPSGGESLKGIHGQQSDFFRLDNIGCSSPSGMTEPSHLSPWSAKRRPRAKLCGACGAGGENATDGRVFCPRARAKRPSPWATFIRPLRGLPMGSWSFIMLPATNDRIALCGPLRSSAVSFFSPMPAGRRAPSESPSGRSDETMPHRSFPF